MDVEDRRSAAARALFEAEARFAVSSPARVAPTWVIELEAQSIIDANEAALAEYGYTRAEFLALRMRDLRVPHDHSQAWRARAAAMRGHDLLELYRHVRKDGSQFAAEVRVITFDSAVANLRLVRATRLSDFVSGADETLFLLKANELLLAGMDIGDVCRTLAALLVEVLADWCIVHRISNATGTLAACGVAHADSSYLGLLQEFSDRRTIPDADALRVTMARGTVVSLEGDAARASLLPRAGENAAEGIAGGLGASSILYLPVLGPAGTVAVLECVRTARPHTARERALGIELAQRAAIAMDRAVARGVERRATPASSSAVTTREQDDLLARASLEAMPECFIHVDREWIIRGANVHAETLLRRPRHEMAGLSLWTLFPHLHGHALEAPLRRAMRDHRAQTADAHVQELDAWFEVHASPIDSGLGIFFRDISAVRRSFRRLEERAEQAQDFVESATDLIHMIAPDGRVLFANRAWRETLGYSEEEALRLTVSDVIAPRSLERARSVMARCFRGEPSAEEDLVVLTKSGEERVVRGRANCRFIDGIAVSTRGIYRDVTALVETQALLGKAERAQAATARARIAFLDRMSHEMRTPLSAIIGFGGLLEQNRSGTLNARDVDFAKRIGTQGRHLLALIEDALGYAELEGRRAELEIAPVDLTTLVIDTSELYREKARLQGVDLELAVPSTPVTMQTDPAALRRVLRYCINDAITLSGTARLVVSLEADAATQRPSRLEIRSERRDAVTHAVPAPPGNHEPSAPLALGLSVAQSLAETLGFDMMVQTPAEGVSLRVIDFHPAPGRARASESSAKTLHAILDASPLPILAFDGDWTVRLWNKAAEGLYGWPSTEAIERRLAIIPPAQEGAFRALLRQAVTAPKGITDVLTEQTDREGRRLDVNVSLAPMRDASDRLRGFLCIATDVSARLRMEEDLRQARQLEIVGRLAGGIAHDFNNLLSVILAHAQFIGEDVVLTAEQREDLEGIRGAAQQAAALTRQLLTFARKERPHLRLVDLNFKLTKTERLLRPILGAHIEFAAVTSPDRLMIHADPSQIEQVLMNLTINARDAMPEGGSVIVEAFAQTLGEDAVARGVVPSPGRYATVVVSDTGIGMSDETRRRIFEPFFSTKGADRGTGLGLATVHAIVTDAKGAIEVLTAPGEGTTFRVHFPLSDHEPDEPALDVAETVARMGRGETILIVEDQEAMRAIATRVLQARGYSVLGARHGSDALALLESHHGVVSLVLSDLMMPEMHGYELARRIRERHPALPVLFMSGYNDLPERDEVAGMPIRLLRKPFGADDLAAAVRATLDVTAG